MKLEREEAFGPLETEYLWCLHCERAYHISKIRNVRIERAGVVLQMCGYDGCDGDTVLDGWDWKVFQRGHPMYPLIPVEGEYYPLYAHEKGN